VEITPNEFPVRRKARVLLKQSLLRKIRCFQVNDAAYVLVNPSGPGLVQH
jgi:hypothetical protein